MPRSAAPLFALTVVAVACKPPVPVVTAPVALEHPMPAPERVADTQAAKDGKHGAVRVGYCVDTDGKPQDIHVIEPLEPEFDALAQETVASWRFTPAAKDGVPFEQCTDVRIELRP